MFGIISDVHGNYPALLAVMDKLDALGCGQIISLGDMAGYYCMVNECIELCRKRNVVNIMGNHDYYLTHNLSCPRSNSANLCLDHQRRTITRENMEWLADSVDLIDTEVLSLRHGGWKGSLDEYIDVFDFGICDGKRQKVFGSGHTHRQQKVIVDGITYFNPGSVGQPRDGDSMAAYAVIDDNQSALLYRTPYPIDQICDAMREQGFSEKIFRCLYTGTKIGEIITCRHND